MDTGESFLYRGLVFGGGCLFVLVLLFVWVLMQQRKNFMRRSSAFYEQELLALENAAAHIARDLHDDIGSILFNVKLTLGSIKDCGAENEKIVKESLQLLRKITSKIKNISASMVPAELKEHGLVYAVQDFIVPLQLDGPVKITLEANLSNEPQEKISLQLFRVMQELLHNSLRHAAAESITVKLFENKKYLYLQVSDDGKGFSGDADALQKGQGLSNIRSRIAFLDGSFQIRKNKGKGVSFQVRIPGS